MDKHTQLREHILEEFKEFILDNDIPIVCMRVAGSMSYARNHDIRESSDIDIDLFVKIQDLHLLNPLLEVANCHKMFSQDEGFSKVDIIASYGEYRGVEINFWLINVDTVGEINSFRKDYLLYYSKYKYDSKKKYKVFRSGKVVELDRGCQKFLDGYLSKRHVLHGEELLSENYILNNMFKAEPILNNRFGEEMTSSMWKSFLGKYADVQFQEILTFLPDKVIPRLSDEFKAKLQRKFRKYS